MTHLSFIECCQLLAIDPKTLRQWLIQAQITLSSHPKDARIKCLSLEQVHLLASDHGRLLPPATDTSPPGSVSSQPPHQNALCALSDAHLQARLVQMETQIATLQRQLTDLTLQLLREREQRTEARLLALEAECALADPLSVPFPPVAPHLIYHPTEKRQPLVPLIEYGAKGQYVLISPEEGEMAIEPDSPEWFAWLASLSSFRFVGKSGRFSARRGYNRKPNRSWYAQRGIHQKNYSKYVGVSEHITIARLEHIAASFQSYLK